MVLVGGLWNGWEVDCAKAEFGHLLQLVLIKCRGSTKLKAIDLRSDTASIEYPKICTGGST
jgi:hypothetical protein